jgi:Uma2 family endonuclease
MPPGLRLTPEQFALVCEANPEAVLELAADGQLIAMTPTGGETSRRNTRLLFRLQAWAERRGGWEVFDSSTGFRLPDGSVLSPDAAVLRLERWQALTPEQRRGFPPLCPDLVVELVSPSVAAGFSEGVEGPRGSEALRRKMAAYLANGYRQRRPAGLAAVSRTAGGGDLAAGGWPCGAGGNATDRGGRGAGGGRVAAGAAA